MKQFASITTSLIVREALILFSWIKRPTQHSAEKCTSPLVRTIYFPLNALELSFDEFTSRYLAFEVMKWARSIPYDVTLRNGAVNEPEVVYEQFNGMGMTGELLRRTERLELILRVFV